MTAFVAANRAIRLSSLNTSNSFPDRGASVFDMEPSRTGRIVYMQPIARHRLSPPCLKQKKCIYSSQVHTPISISTFIECRIEQGEQGVRSADRDGVFVGADGISKLGGQRIFNPKFPQRFRVNVLI
jgi:hypothetical protein